LFSAFEVKRLIFMGPKYLREEFRKKATKNQVGISDGKGTTWLAIAYRAGVCSCGFRADLVEASLKEKT
jgi:hypothetical protein